jgi:predicted transcriptional regulator
VSGPSFATRSPEAGISGRSPADVLRAAGPLLYGEFWQSAAARLLGVTDRSVRHWLTGTRTAPGRIVGELEAALRERLALIQEHLRTGD